MANKMAFAPPSARDRRLAHMHWEGLALFYNFNLIPLKLWKLKVGSDYQVKYSIYGRCR